MVFFTTILHHNDVQYLRMQLGDDCFCLVPSIHAGHFCGIVKDVRYAQFLAAMPVASLECLEYLEREEFCAKVRDENQVQDITIIGSHALFHSVIPHE